ncbi:MAG: SemiSWEET family sugar transporter [Alphaproteobacteria bacterium]
MSLQHVVTIVGSIAALCSMVSFTPQAWKIIRTRETKDISAGMYSLTVSAFAFWCLYGALLREWPLIVSNGVCLALSGFILAMTLLPQRKKEAVADAIEDSKAAILPVPSNETRDSVAERNGG